MQICSYRLAASVIASVLFVVATCTLATAQTPQPLKCPFITSSDALTNCRRLADAGSTEAMLTLAEGYARGFTLIERRPFSGPELIKIPADQIESQRYYSLAADLGDKNALRHLFEEYHFGRVVPKNDALAERYQKKSCGIRFRMGNPVARASTGKIGAGESFRGLPAARSKRQLRCPAPPRSSLCVGSPCQKKSDAGIFLASTRQGQCLCSKG
jgi:hypothetical protein